MNHPDEETLELYLLESDDVRSRRGEIQAHLNECASCTALLKEMEGFYTDVKEIRAERANVISQALTLRSMAVKVPSHRDFGPLSQIRKTVPARVMLFGIRHPIAASAGFIALLLAGILALSPQIWKQSDTNPAYARAKDEFLVVYNKDGEVLWKKHIGREYERESSAEDPQGQGLSTVDVDGDGQNEIIAVFCLARRQFLMDDHVVCYKADGNVLWKYDFHRAMTFESKSCSGDYLAGRMITGDFDADGRYEVVLIARHDPYWPSVVIRLDARSGSQLSEYWHSGHLANAAQRDINADGIEDLFFCGENNAFDRSSLLVLDPRRIEGHAPATADYTPRGIQEGTEEYYILLPRSDLQELSSRPRSKASMIRFKEDGSIEVRSTEQVGEVWYEIFFEFDDSLRCVRVELVDHFRTLHRRMEEEGKVTRKVDEQYLEDLRQGVQYWDGERFVHKPTMNSRYSQIVKR